MKNKFIHVEVFLIEGEVVKKDMILNTDLIESAEVGRAGTSQIIFNGQYMIIELPFQSLTNLLCE